MEGQFKKMSDMTKEERNKYYRAYYKKSKETINSRNKEYRKKWFQQYYQNNKSAVIERSMNYYYGEKHEAIKEKNRLHKRRIKEKIEMLEKKGEESAMVC